MRWIALVALTLPLSGASSSARADYLETSRSMPVAEISHTVDIRIDRGVATYVVQRQFKNSGTQADEVRLELQLPTGAAATGLRIRAGRQWYAGELLEATVAAERYQELTGLGAGQPKDPALLYWSQEGQLGLQVFPVMPGTTSTVEYTLTVPTRYEAGRYLLTYPRAAAETGLVDPVITVRTDEPYLLDGQRLTASARSKIARDTTEQAELTVAPSGIATWTGRLGRVVASDAKAITRFELDVAPRLARVPRRAQVVFAIDASYSVGEGVLDAQLAIVRAYAKHVPDAEVELVVYRRKAQRVFGAFVPVAKLDAAITAAEHAGAFALGNGSALDEAARIASAALATRSGPRRLVLMTDVLVRSTLTPDVALAALGVDRDTVVHVVLPAEHSTGLARDDAADFARLATSHHGIYATVHTGEKLDTTALELVRPVRIDAVTVTAGFSIDAGELPEGSGVRIAEIRPRAEAPQQVALTGKLWSDPIKLVISSDASFSTATAALVFGDSMHTALDEAAQLAVARAGNAVSPMTSFLAIEPGVRPSTIGLDRHGVGWGSIGSGSYSTTGCSGLTIGRHRKKPDLASRVDTTACLAKHAPAPVQLTVETTEIEIVDVAVTGAPSPLASCLAETVWKLQLDKTFDRTQETFVVDFP